MTESTLWSVIQPKLAPYGVVERIENRLDKGTGDVAYVLLGVDGWLELKEVDQWPKRGGPLKLPHFTREQLLWHKARHRARGRAGVLAQVGWDYLLLPPWHLDEVYAGATRERYAEMAVVKGHRAFPTTAIVKWLARKDPEMGLVRGPNPLENNKK